MSQIKCPSCGCISEEDAKFCKNCGNMLQNCSDNSAADYNTPGSDNSNTTDLIDISDKEENVIKTPDDPNQSIVLNKPDITLSDKSKAPESNLPVNNKKEHSIKRIFSVIISVFVGLFLFSGLSFALIGILFSSDPSDFISDALFDNSETKLSDMKIGKAFDIVVNDNSGTDDIELSEDTTLSEFIYQLISNQNRSKYEITEEKIAAVLNDKKSEKLFRDFLKDIEIIIAENKTSDELYFLIENLFNDAESVLKDNGINYTLRKIDKQAIREFTDINFNRENDNNIITQSNMPLLSLLLISVIAGFVSFMLMLLIIVFLNIRKLNLVLLYLGVPVLTAGTIYLAAFIILPLILTKVLLDSSLIVFILKAVIDCTIVPSALIGGVCCGVGIICIICYIVSKAVILFKNKRSILEGNYE